MKHLVIEVKKVEGWGILGRVKEQTHRGEEFGDKNNGFTSSNGLEIVSCHEPDCGNAILFVLGDGICWDNKVFIIPSEKQLSRIRQAVKEYNLYFGREETKDDGVEIIE